MNNKKIFSVKMFWQSFLQLKVIGFISTILMVLITCVPICISAVNIKSNIEELKKKIRNQIDEQNQLYLEIRKSFSKYVEMIIDKPGLLSIGENRNGNVEFKSEIYNAENELTAEGDGYSYKKILCACFDLAIITNYSDKSFIKFIYHDGCLETLDPRKQKNYLDLIQNLCDKYNIQYILTLIESDLPVLEGKKYELSQRCNVAVELSDKDETSSLLSFKLEQITNRGYYSCDSSPPLKSTKNTLI